MSGENEDLDFGDNFTPTPDDPKDLRTDLERKELESVQNAASTDESDESKVDLDDKEDEEKVEAKESASSETDDKEVKDEEGKDKERSKVIPRERFDAAQRKAQAREEALKARIEALEKDSSAHKLSGDMAKLQEALEAAHDKYEDAVIEGDKAKARQFRAEWMRLQDVLVEVKTNVSSEAAKRETIATLKYDAVLAKAESEHPELNPDSDQYDESLTDEVGVLLEAFVLKGFTRDVALQKAVRYVVGDAPKKDPDNVEPHAVAAKRAEEARKKAADAVKRQPSNTNKTGLDSDKGGNKHSQVKDVDLMRMSQERFAKIDEETLAKLRGDYI